MGHWPLALGLDLPFGQSQVKVDSVHNQISPGFPRLSPWTPKVRTASATRTAAFRLANLVQNGWIKDDKSFSNLLFSPFFHIFPTKCSEQKFHILSVFGGRLRTDSLQVE